MSWQGFGRNNNGNSNGNTGPGSWHLTTTQTASLNGSLLNSSVFSPRTNNSQQPQQPQQQFQQQQQQWEQFYQQQHQQNQYQVQQNPQQPLYQPQQQYQQQQQQQRQGQQQQWQGQQQQLQGQQQQWQGQQQQQWQGQQQQQQQYQQQQQNQNQNQGQQKKRRQSVSKPKIFPCTVEGCGRMLESPHNVHQHIREKHTLERPHWCVLCAADGKIVDFTRPWGLTRHNQQVHGIDPPPGRRGRGVPAPAPAPAPAPVPAPAAAAAAFPASFPARTPARTLARTPAQTPAGTRPGTPVPAWQRTPYQNQYGEEFAELGFRLTQVNAQMRTPQMRSPSNRPQFGASGFGMPAGGGAATYNTQQQHDPSLTCIACGYIANSYDDILEHAHVRHSVPRSQNCACNGCSMMFTSDHELRNGALRSQQNTGFSHGGQGGWYPQQQQQAGSTSGGNNNGAQGNFAIDPALLSYSSSGGSS